MQRLLIVADIRIYREGLAEVLRRTPGIEVVGLAAGRDEAMARIGQLAPDTVLVDTAMRGGLDLIRGVVAAEPRLKVVALGVAEAEDVLACAEAGIAGYVPREASLADLLAAVESVGRGEALCSPAVAATLLRRVAALAGGAATAGLEERLTTRERQILRLVDGGLSNKEIARDLGIEVATVKNHVHNILDKLQVERRGQAAARLRRPRTSSDFRPVGG
jgi:DNA-binding NarL/FixJ family response regulator